MMEGSIDSELQAILPVSVLHRNQHRVVDFVIDTGFNGFLSLSHDLVRRFDLNVVDIQRGITADGRLGVFEVVDVCINWHGQPLIIAAHILGDALIGTRLLEGSEINFSWRAGEPFAVCPGR